MARALPTRAGGCCRPREGIHPLQGSCQQRRERCRRQGSGTYSLSAVTTRGISLSHLARADGLWDFSTVLQCRAYADIRSSRVLYWRHHKQPGFPLILAYFGKRFTPNRRGCQLLWQPPLHHEPSIVLSVFNPCRIPGPDIGRW